MTSYGRLFVPDHCLWLPQEDEPCPLLHSLWGVFTDRLWASTLFLLSATGALCHAGEGPPSDLGWPAATVIIGAVLICFVDAGDGNLAAQRGERNILESGLLHRAMLFFQRPVHWPAWLVGFVGLLAAIGVGATWWALSAPWTTTLLAATAHLLFFVADALIFLALPRLGISFGSWKTQSTVLAVPRLLASLALPLLGLWLGWNRALAALLLAQSAGTILLVWGAMFEPRRLTLTDLHLTLSGLPPDVAPVRLLHISDVHLERITKREREVLRLVEVTRPHLIVMTGDYLNLSYNQDQSALAQLQEMLSQLWAPHGVYATLGSPPVDLRQTVTPLFSDLQVRLLRNEWTMVDVGGGRQIVLLGLDCTHHLDEDARRLEQVARDAPDHLPRVLLYHSPELMPHAPSSGVDLYLCGHTHGGQVRLPLVGPVITSSQLGRRYVMGHYHNGSSHLYVSRGIGLEGLSAPRVRLLSSPEVTLVTLHPRP